VRVGAAAAVEDVARRHPKARARARGKARTAGIIGRADPGTGAESGPDLHQLSYPWKVALSDIGASACKRYRRCESGDQREAGYQDHD
jgi:hypothetical protein